MGSNPTLSANLLYNRLNIKRFYNIVGCTHKTRNSLGHLSPFVGSLSGRANRLKVASLDAGGDLRVVAFEAGGEAVFAVAPGRKG